MKALDAYYTPPAIARAVARAIPRNPRVVLDPSCGDGSLLSAVVARFPRASVFGLDKSESTVRRLTTREPEWVLSVGDATDPLSLARTRVARHLTDCDLVVINPPFTMGAEKGVEFRLGSRPLRGSPAMQHLAVSCRQFRPAVAVAVLPESALFSHLDQQIRTLLERDYECEPMARNDSCAFEGARARTRVVRFRRRKSTRDLRGGEATQVASRREPVTLIRGGLQMFRARVGRTPLLHTTDLQRLTDAHRELAYSRFVKRAQSGCVCGHFALVPRVGSPPLNYRPRVLFSARDVQLSDCLIAVGFPSKAIGERFVGQLGTLWGALLRDVFVGTGAPYVTMDRFRRWIEEHTSFSCMTS